MRQTKGKAFNAVLPPLVWLIAVGAVIWLYMQRSQSYSVAGLARSQVYLASCVADVTVARLPVQLYQKVSRGDVLVVAEQGIHQDHEYTKALFDAQRATAQAELKRLEAELNAAREDLLESYEMQASERARRLADLTLDIEKARLAALTVKTDLEPDRIELESLKLEKTILEQLLARDAVEPYEVEKASQAYEQMAVKVTQQQALLDQIEQDLQAARERLAQLPENENDTRKLQIMLEPFSRAIEVQTHRLAELFLPVSEIVVKAPFDGVVTDIVCQEGQAIMGGSAMLTLSRPQADCVVVWLDPSQSDLIMENQEIEIMRNNQPRMRIQTKVEAISSTIEPIPQQMWRHPTVPEWGRPVRILVPDGISLLSNEIVGVRGVMPH